MKNETRLRRGWTTGACATAAAVAAFRALRGGNFPDSVEIELDNGKRPVFVIALKQREGKRCTAGIIKDAGDDPDVTHQAMVVVSVEHGATGSGVSFRAGEGVGTVTRMGLPLDVGEPAINPAPRQMIQNAIKREGGDDVIIEIAVPGGEELAQKTWNPKLGIKGGLSILGTTGIVIPYSCSAWIHSIQQGIDVARAAGIQHIGAATGKLSEALLRKHGLDETATIDMGDFVGGFLKYLRKHPVERVTIAGGAGKISKLANGANDLHSRRSNIDFYFLAVLAKNAGASESLVQRIKGAESIGEVLLMCEGLNIGDAIASAAHKRVVTMLPESTAVELLVINRSGILIGRAE
ncbi:MAG: cobalt-precorrin-5B (C(1))-methyltransferase [Hyphomicrobiales bacterium]|nr:cobalt-precorrin-5B (C(1))-methyltransferase [Hyphomicrobiales bacterium]MCY4053875.1 cobalt-precorrin-5B (C(1))-methyltransferase [Hyphomicrobiales bacterium]